LAIPAHSLKLRDKDAARVFGLSGDYRELGKGDGSRSETSECPPTKHSALYRATKRNPLGKMKPAVATNLFRVAQPGVQSVGHRNQVCRKPVCHGFTGYLILPAVTPSRKGYARVCFFFFRLSSRANGNTVAKNGSSTKRCAEVTWPTDFHLKGHSARSRT